MSQNQQSFMDPKTILAILLVAAGWAGWQYHMQQKYPDAYKRKPPAESVAQKPKGELKEPSKSSNQQPIEAEKDKSGQAKSLSNTKNGEIAEAAQSENLTTFSDEQWSFEISSRGMGLKDIKLKSYSSREGKEVVLGAEGEVLPFETRLVDRNYPIHFDVAPVEGNKVVGTASVNGLEITKTIHIKSDKFTLDTEVQVRRIQDNFTGLSTFIVDHIREKGEGFMFVPNLEHQEFFVLHSGGDEEREIIDEETGFEEQYSQVKVASIGSQYFAQAVVDKSDVMPRVRSQAHPRKAIAITELKHSLLNRSSHFTINYTAFAGPKSVDLLSSIDEDLASVVNLGFFSSLGRPVLKVLKWFHSIFGNWGVAIILLTLLVRLVVLPANIMSYKSMKTMQKIQPQLKKIREKYKDEPQKLNQEMMTLMKANKANPLGGCLPMLLQFPIFIALYQVLGQSIELYQAPFVLWIDDLSMKDPYYVLPVLMGLAIFLQQKMTPNTLDPTQAKVLMFMPVMFTVFMLSLPSGLTLYMFVSGLFAIVQQYIFMRPNQQEALATNT